LSGQGHEGRLEGVLGVVPVAKQSPADAQDQWAMPPHQSHESSLVTLVGKALQQLAVRQF
jgi:hypothetical protein